MKYVDVYIIEISEIDYKHIKQKWVKRKPVQNNSG